jgi:hypothetical protein
MAFSNNPRFRLRVALVALVVLAIGALPAPGQDFDQDDAYDQAFPADSGGPVVDPPIGGPAVGGEAVGVGDPDVGGPAVGGEAVGIGDQPIGGPAVGGEAVGEGDAVIGGPAVGGGPVEDAPVEGEPLY